MRTNILALAFFGFVSSAFAQKGFIQEGVASFYAESLKGKPTTNGESYNPEEKTAAHPTLPYNSKIKLTNLDNGKTVIVRINDRFKGENGKVAILSKSAAEEIGLIYAGKARVKIEDVNENATATVSSSSKVMASVQPKEVVVNTSTMEDYEVNHVYDLKGHLIEQNGYGLQLGAFAQLKAAREYAQKLSDKQEDGPENLFIQVSKSEDKPLYYRVVYGFFSNEVEAKGKQKELASLGFSGLSRMYGRK